MIFYPIQRAPDFIDVGAVNVAPGVGANLAILTWPTVNTFNAKRPYLVRVIVYADEANQFNIQGLDEHGTLTSMYLALTAAGILDQDIILFPNPGSTTNITVQNAAAAGKIYWGEIMAWGLLV